MTSKLHVSHRMYDRMQKAAMQAEMDGFDQSIAAWRVTGLPLPPMGTKFSINITIDDDPVYPDGQARVDPA